MESKKLQTIADPQALLVVEPGENYAGRLFDAAVHDARIAHEHRPVILRLSVAINLLIEAMEDGTPQEQFEAENAAQEALAAAEPYITGED